MHGVRDKILEVSGVCLKQTDTSNFTTITWQGDNDSIELMSRTSGTNKFRVKTERLFRDLSAWYHVVVSMNILNETQTEKCKNIHKWQSYNSV